MLIVMLLAAIVFYTIIYLVWDSAHTRLDSVAAVLASLERMVTMDQEVIFVILRWMIFIIAAYVLADVIRSAGRKVKKIVKPKPPEKMELGFKKPPGQS